MMRMYFGKKRKKAFTLAETVIVVTMFSSVIVLILTAVNKYVTYLSQSRLQTIALNLTREGMELLYQWRDTNREKNEGNKDQKIFCIDPFASTCTNIASGYYVIIPKQTETRKVDYFALEKVKTGGTGFSSSDLPEVYSDFSSFLQENDANFDKIKAIKVEFTGEFKGSENFTGKISDLMESEAEFYRMVEINGIYNKRTDSNASNATGGPVELDFCVKTFSLSMDGIVGESELCGLLTNFKE